MYNKIHGYEYVECLTNIIGLKYRPMLISQALNDSDAVLDQTYIYPLNEFSICNQTIVKDILLNNNIQTIVEIGVYRQEPNQHFAFGLPTCPSTVIILENKHDECKYLGIDIYNKMFLNNATKNIFTL